MRNFTNRSHGNRQVSSEIPGAPILSRLKAYWKTVCLALFLVLSVSASSYAQVVITAASSGGLQVCSNKAVGGTNAGFTAVGTFTVTESAKGDFGGNVTSAWAT